MLLAVVLLLDQRGMRRGWRRRLFDSVTGV